MRSANWMRPARLACLGLLLVAGCSTPEPKENPGRIGPDVARAEALFQRGLYADAIIACTELARQDPLTPGLADLQGRILQSLANARRQAVAVRTKPTEEAMLVDLDQQHILPDSYRLRRHVVGENEPIQSAPNAMQEALRRPVSIHLEDVGVSEIVAEIGASENINIVTDSDLGGGTITLHVVDTPLEEVLEYVGRNLNVTFSVGRNIIWATAGASEAGPPLLTRIYRLRKGLTGLELEGSPDSIGIVEAITRFVPVLPGADFLFNKKSHAILIKNTRENILLIEDLIAALDIRPPQVLIEARFMSTTVTDLRELGVDWLLKSPIELTSAGKLVNGAVVTSPQTAISAGSVGFAPFANSAQGLNMTYEGILTDPMFTAVIHALETSGKARTLSMPRVTTINNQEATIRIGEDFRYYENYELDEYEEVVGTGANAQTVTRTQLVPSGTPSVEELGIELTTTPSVGADLASINLKLLPEISEFVRWEYYATAGTDSSSSSSSTNGSAGLIKLPIFRRSRIETEVTVRSGETVVMGGLMTGSRSKTRQGIPFLSWLPLIGQAFRHDIWEESRQNLIIFVTATLLSDVGEELIPLGTPELIDRGSGKLELGVPPPAPAAEPVAAPDADAVEPPVVAPEPAAGGAQINQPAAAARVG